MFVRVLDELDSHDFNVARETNSIDTLYKKLFLPDLLESTRSVSALVIFLCKWAVSPTRAGLHRSIIVACLLEHLRASLPHFGFQQCLLNFLDQHAPATPADTTGFQSLVCLFAELIDRGLFNHDAFVRTFIARGVFDSSLHPLVNNENPSALGTALHSSRTNNNIGHFSVQSEMSEENDRNSVDNPDSVRSDLGGGAGVPGGAQSSPDLNRHLQYLIHFPLPQDESYAHEQNQRAQLLYGSSMRAQNRARETVRKLSRDIGKLFTKSAYRLDVVHGELGKRKKNKEGGTPNSNARGNISGGAKEPRALEELIEVIQTSFRTLSYYDMECVISKNMPTFLRVLSGNSTVSSTNNAASLSESLNESLLAESSTAGSSPSAAANPIYYPMPTSIFLFFELIESSLNIVSLLDTVVNTLERLLATSLTAQHLCMSSYLALVWLRAIGILRTHQAVLLTQPDLQQRVVICLIEQARRGRLDKLQCRQCILTYQKDLHYASAYVKFLFANWNQPPHLRAFEVFPQTPPEVLSRLRKSPDMRSTMINNTLRAARLEEDPERLTTIFESVIEYTLQCPEMDWVPAIHEFIKGASASTSPAPGSPGTLPLSQEGSSQRLSDHVIWDNLAHLICALLARQCIEAETIFDKLINTALILGLEQASAPVDSRIEPTVRLACHILHRLFNADSAVSLRRQQQTQSQQLDGQTAHQPSFSSTFRVFEPLLLTSALQKVTYVHLVDTLKMLMIHSNKGLPSDYGDENEDGSTVGSEDNTSDDDRDSDRDSDDIHGESSIDLTDGFDLTDGPPAPKNKRKRRRVHLASKSKRRRGAGMKRNSSGLGLLKRRNLLPNRIHRCTSNFLTTGQLPTDPEIRTLPLRDFAHLVLREICVTPWVRSYFYRESGSLLQENVLIDNMLSSNQTRYLLHIIYHPHDAKWMDLAARPDNVPEAMIALISGVNIWMLHATRMELNLLCKQSTARDAFEQVANRMVTGFNDQALASLKSSNPADITAVDQLPDGLPDIEIPETDNSWYLPSLIAKLPQELKMQIVTKSCDVSYSLFIELLC